MGSLNKSQEHWEQDRWDDHPAFGADYQLRGAHALASMEASPPPAKKEEEHLNIFQKLLYFLAHPIKTLSKPESGIHGSMDRSQRPGSAFAGLPGHSQTPEAWWESRYTDTDWSR